MEPGVLGALALVLLLGWRFLAGCLGQSSFPTPLTEEEEANYLALLEKGDETARSVLVERNLRLVAHIVKKFDNTGDDTDDLISIGTLGLIKAINSYDKSKGTRLATYAARCIENEILMHLRATKRARREVFLHDPIGVDREGNEITLMDVLGTDGETVPELVGSRFEVKRLLDTIGVLDRRERRVLELRYGLGGGPRRTQREIARILGISRSYVSRIEKRAVSRLLKELSPD
ncbi:MAG: RNA polymerase sporulation sigma factor SigK [Bacillota bacterium]